MAWNELKPVKPGTHTGATIAIGGTGKTPRLIVKLGPVATPNAFRGGVNVSAAIGSESEFGLLRLASDGLAAFKLSKVPKGEAIKATLPLPAGVIADRQDHTPVTIKSIGKNEIVLELPDWARPKVMRAGVPPVSPGGYRSVMDGPAPKPPAKSTGADDRVRETVKGAGVTRVVR